MRSILFRIPLYFNIPFIGNSLPIYAYGFMVMVGFLTAIYVARRRAALVGIDPNAVMDIGLRAIIFGVLGARLFHIIEFHRFYFDGQDNPFVKMIAINHGGLVWYGGLLLAAAAIMLYLRRHRLPFMETLDVLAPSTMLGLAFGRIGCFLNGCCYGKPTNVPWAITFPDHAHAYVIADGKVSPDMIHTFPPGTPLHPTEIYMFLGALALFFILSYVFRHRRRQGEVVLYLGLLYPIDRFINEIFRADTAAPGGLTTSQTLGIVVFCMALAYGWWLFRYGRKAAPLPAAPPAKEKKAPPAEAPSMQAKLAEQKNGKRRKRKKR